MVYRGVECGSKEGITVGACARIYHVSPRNRKLESTRFPGVQCRARLRTRRSESSASFIRRNEGLFFETYTNEECYNESSVIKFTTIGKINDNGSLYLILIFFYSLFFFLMIQTNLSLSKQWWICWQKFLIGKNMDELRTD